MSLTSMFFRLEDRVQKILRRRYVAPPPPLSHPTDKTSIRGLPYRIDIGTVGVARIHSFVGMYVRTTGDIFSAYSVDTHSV